MRQTVGGAYERIDELDDKVAATATEIDAAKETLVRIDKTLDQIREDDATAEATREEREPIPDAYDVMRELDRHLKGLAGFPTNISLDVPALVDTLTRARTLVNRQAGIVDAMRGLRAVLVNPDLDFPA